MRKKTSYTTLGALKSMWQAFTINCRGLYKLWFTRPTAHELKVIRYLTPKASATSWTI